MYIIALKLQGLLLNMMLLILGVLNIMMYYDIDVKDILGHVPYSFAENFIKVSNYAFIDINANNIYDSDEQTIPISINFKNYIILPNKNDIFKMGPLGDGSYSYSINVPVGLKASIGNMLSFVVEDGQVYNLKPIALVTDPQYQQVIQRKTYLTEGFDDINHDGIRQSNEATIAYTLFDQDHKIIKHSDEGEKSYRLGVLPDNIYYYQTYKHNILEKTYFSLINGSPRYDIDQTIAGISGGVHASAQTTTEHYQNPLSQKTYNNPKHKLYHKKIAHTTVSPIFQSNHTILKYLIERNVAIKKNNLTYALSHQTSNSDILSTVGIYQTYTTKQTAQIYKLIFENIISYLGEQKILTQTQIQDLGKHTQFIYTKECKRVEGNIVFRYNPKSANLEKMDIYVPSCGRPAIVKKLGEAAFELVAHEIGHYLYHYDNKKKLFINICWESNKLRSQCSTKGFERSYGKQNPSEDYAESFMLWLKYKNNTNFTKDDIIDQKMNYFESKFGDLQTP